MVLLRTASRPDDNRFHSAAQLSSEWRLWVESGRSHFKKFEPPESEYGGVAAAIRMLNVRNYRRAVFLLRRIAIAPARPAPKSESVIGSGVAVVSIVKYALLKSRPWPMVGSPLHPSR